MPEQTDREFLDSIAQAHPIKVATFIRWLRAIANEIERQSLKDPSDWEGAQALPEWIGEAKGM